MTLTAAPITGLGATLSIGTLGASPTFTVIGGDTKITPPEPKFGTEDTTTLATAGGVRTFIKTLQDPGETTIEGNYESADPGQIALSTAAAAISNQLNGAAYPFKFTLPINGPGGQTTTGDVYAFNALVLSFAVSEVEAGKLVTFKSSLKLTGPITYTEGS